ncbi:hypothetical protein MRX96_035492 [Rhipicephalus microplus]
MVALCGFLLWHGDGGPSRCVCEEEEATSSGALIVWPKKEELGGWGKGPSLKGNPRHASCSLSGRIEEQSSRCGLRRPWEYVCEMRPGPRGLLTLSHDSSLSGPRIGLSCDCFAYRAAAIHYRRR